jgi:GAF domain-containing protein
MLGPIVATARVVFGAAACSIAVVDEAGEHLVFRAADGEGADGIVGVSIPATRGIAGWALSTGQAIAVGDVASDVRFAADTAEQTGYSPTAILAAPLLDNGQAVGVIEVLDPGAERGLDILGRFADLAALALRIDMPAPPPATAAEEALRRAAIDFAREQQG